MGSEIRDLLTFNLSCSCCFIIDTLEFVLEFNGQLKGEVSSAFANVFKLTVGRSLKFVAVKKFGRELGNDDHNTKWTAR